MDTPTLLTKGQNLANVQGTTVNTASISPGSNKLVVVNVFVSVFSGTPPTITIPTNHLGLTWSQKVSHVLDHPQARQVVWTGIGASPGSGAIDLQVGASGATEALVWEILEIGGVDPAAPVTQVVPYVGSPVSPTTHTITLSALGSGSPGVVALWARSNGDATAAILAAPAPYTLLDEALSGNGSNPGALAASYKVIGTTTTTITSTVDFIRVNGLALEIKSLVVDTTPDSFTLDDRVNVQLGSVHESNTVAIAGLGAAVAISIVAGEYSKNGGTYTASAGTIGNGDTLKVRHTASSSPRATVTSVVTVGDFAEGFSTTTGHFRQGKSGSTNLSNDLDLALTLDAQALPSSVLYWDVASSKTDNATPGVFGNVSSPGWDVIDAIDSGASGYTKLTRLRRVVKDDALNGGSVASEPTTYTVTSDFGGSMYRINGAIVELVGMDTTTPEDVATQKAYNNSTSANIPAPDLSAASAQTVRLDAFAGSDGNTQLDVAEGITPPGTMIEREEIIENNRYLFLAVADEVRSTIGATGTRTATFPTTSHKTLAISTLVRVNGSGPSGGLLLLSDFGANPGFAIRV